MSAIRGRDTRPELILRSSIHALGLRYRLHDGALPGKPDLVFPRYRAVIFVHGCFWHRHGCAASKVPSTRTAFWVQKLEANRLRDARSREALSDKGWRVGVVWECSLLGKTRYPATAVAAMVCNWLQGESESLEVVGSG